VPLTSLDCSHTQIADLEPLKGKKLTTLNCIATGVTDLAPLRGMPLKALECNFRPERDAAILRSIKTLEQINGEPAAKLLPKAGNTAPPKP